MMPPPPPPVDPTPAPASEALAARSRHDDGAVAALVLGVISVLGIVCWVGIPFGVPAIALGARAHRDIRGSNGAATGHGMATAGIVLGTVGSVLSLVFIGFVALAVLQGGREHSANPPPGVVLTVAEGATDRGEGATAPPLAAPASSVIHLHPSAGPLRAQLATQAAAARRAGQRVLLETTAQECEPCAEIALAAADPRVEDALSNVRYLRADADEFHDDLKALRMYEPTAPWFFLIDVRGLPSDAISADEWGDNDPDEIAPVLGAFVRGRLESRRGTWRGETAL